MVNVFISGLFTIFSLFIFIGSTRINEVNRLIMYMPKSIFENAVTYRDYQSIEDFYFVKAKLESDVLEYFQTSISHRSIQYDVSFTYFNVDGVSYCVSDKCQGVKVTLSTRYFLDYEYQRSMSYQIGEGV